MKTWGQLTRREWLWMGIGACVILALLLFHMKDSFERQMNAAKKEYHLSVVLSEQREEKTRMYQSILETASLPPPKELDDNLWIQQVQNLVSTQKLSLQELRPNSGRDNSGRRKTEIDLIVEGKVGDFISFLNEIAKAEDYVYVKYFSATSRSERDGLIRVQITLAQI